MLGVKLLSTLLLPRWVSARIAPVSPALVVRGEFGQTLTGGVLPATTGDEFPQDHQERGNYVPDPLALKTPVTQFVADVRLPATTIPLVVRDQFKPPTRIKYATVWDDFKTRFFGKSEALRPELTLRKFKLLAFVSDGPIIAELGGECQVECPLSVVFDLLLRQTGGQAGFLQTNGFANIFYVRDDQGTLCAVQIGWAEDGWVLDAVPVDDLAWNGGHMIFSPAPSVG